MKLNLDFQVLHPQQCNMGSASYRVFPSRDCTFGELVEQILKRNEFGTIKTTNDRCSISLRAVI